MAERFPLHKDLQEAVEAGLLTLAEADLLQNEILLHPTRPWPKQMRPLVRRLEMLEWEPSEMTRQ